MKTQLEFQIPRRGGFREGAGRPRLLKHDPVHLTRPKITARDPAHVTIRFVKGVPSLRDEKFVAVFARALERAKGKGLKIIQFAIESNHIHFIIEGASNEAVTRGMLALQGSITWGLRKIFGWFGAVFEGRFDLHKLTSPREVRNALLYVIFNHAKHCGAERFADVFSSAFAFAELGSYVRRPGRAPRWQAQFENVLSAPTSWLLTVGWKR